jgi:acetylornithine deacetylase
MPQDQGITALQSAIDRDQVASLMSDLIQIPSHRWEEGEIASYVAGYMRGMGLEVTVQAVEEGEVSSKQAIGILRGTGEGPSVMLCGHLDTSTSPPSRSPYRPDMWTKDPYGGVIEDGWIYGLGAVNMKGGVAAMLEAVRAISESNLTPRGDIYIAAVMGETAGGLGVEYLLDAGFRTDMAIVTECTDMDIVTLAVAACRGHIHLEGETAHHLAHKSAVEIASELVAEMGPSFAPIPENGSLLHTPHPKLPGYPRFAFREAHTYGNDFCKLTYDCRIIPGQSPNDVADALEAVLAKLGIVGHVEQPPHPHIRNRPTAPETPPEHGSVASVAKWYQHVLSKPPSVGAGKRLGGASDASNLQAAGIPSVTFGPGGIDVWPMVDERCKVDDVFAATEIIALATAELTEST